jgi:alanyl-tRNA synthetase
VDFGPFLFKKMAGYTPKWPFHASTFHVVRPRFVSKQPMLNFTSMATHRIYYDDSFEKNFEARVLSCEPGVARKTDFGIREVWDAVLDSTAFYPTSGGQPNDLGKIGEAEVLDVREEDEEIIHVVDRVIPNGQAKCCLDWTRRFDHMQQHTGQHLLSAIFQERFGLPTVSFHLGAEVSTIDLRGPEPAAEILAGAVRAANQVIFEDRPITVRYGTSEQFAAMGVRKEVERSGILRAIEIEGADLQACGGTHVKRTGQIGLIALRKVSKIRQDWRVEFVCGARAARFAHEDFQLIRKLSESLGVAPDDATQALENIRSERDAHHKNLRATLQRLAQAESVAALAAANEPAGKICVVAMVLNDIQPEYLTAFASEIVKKEKAVALLGHRELGHLIFAQGSSVGLDMNALLKQVLAKIPGKGGGTKDFVRAKLNNASDVDQAIVLTKSLLTSTQNAAGNG